MLQRLLDIGVIPNSGFYQKREIRMLNLFSYLTLIGLLIGATNIIFLGESYPWIIILSQTFSSLLILFLNYQKRNDISVYFFVISMNVTLFYINSYYDPSAGSYLYYFPVIFCISLLHDPNRSIFRIITFFGVILISFFLSRYVKFDFIQKANLTQEQNHLIFNYNINISAVITISLVFLVISVVNRQYKELEELIVTAKSDKMTIQNSLLEKDVLLAEIQHRVKNNLAVIIGLFNIQKETAVNEETKQAMIEAKNRVLSIAMVHERLYKKEDLSHINLKNYISDLSKEIIQGHPLSKKITIHEELSNLQADITKAVPIGLIINEAITNSLKHAFCETANPSIKLLLEHRFGEVCIKIEDNGKGIQEDIQPNEKSLGIELMKSLSEQIDGKIQIKGENGTTVKLTFPV